MLFLGLDDTDTLDSRGTGHLARSIAAELAADHVLLGVIRHQLLRDPRVPCTKNNSSATIVLDGDAVVEPVTLLERVRLIMRDNYQPGSDPGLCLATSVPAAITDFGRRTQQELVTQAEARALASAHGLPLVGLGGDEGGVIGALAAVGLAAGGEDGRYVLVGRCRELQGLQPVQALLAAGVAAVQTLDGQPVTDGLVQTDRLRPARRGGRPIAFVQWNGECWLPLKLD
jgi:tRNA(Ile2) C34 agmatinyltransferase TiaS